MDYDIQRNIEQNYGKSLQSDDPVKLSIQHILGATFLLLLGSTGATFVFLIEILWFWYCNKK